MELTLESAFSTGGLVGHLSYLLLIVSMMMRSMLRLRLLVIASALVGISYSVFWLNDPVGLFWESLLLSVNLVQITLLWRANHRARFSPEEERLAERLLGDLPKGRARVLLDKGTWSGGPADMQLTREGEAPRHLFYISKGEVSIRSGGTEIATCGPGSLVGEMSLVDDGPASATAVATTPLNYWTIPTATVRTLRDSDMDISLAIEAGIAHALKAKLVEANAAQIVAH